MNAAGDAEQGSDAVSKRGRVRVPAVLAAIALVAVIAFVALGALLVAGVLAAVLVGILIVRGIRSESRARHELEAREGEALAAGREHPTATREDGRTVVE